MTADEVFVRVQTALAGEYSLERELGSGGMGIVYLAREVRLARPVALKVLAPSLAGTASVRAMFVREAQLAAALSHPNIIPIHHVGESGDVVYFAMAYIRGITLADHVAKHGALSPAVATRILRDVAWALTYAHSSGVIHCDIKAENILIEEGGGRALLMDFGIAKAAGDDPDANRDGAVMGSAHYVSPEQASGQPLDARSDLYSLGLVGYLMLTGRLPFDGATSAQILQSHLRDQPKPIVSAAPATPPQLAAAIERCLAKRPELRFQSASEFADAIEGANVQVREIPPPIRVWLMRRGDRRGARIFGALYLSTMVAGAAASTGGLAGAVMGFFAALTVVSGFVVVPDIVATRRALRAGFEFSDLTAALRQHWAKRREELAYEASIRGNTPLRDAAIVTVLGGGVLALVLALFASDRDLSLRVVGISTGVIGVGATVAATAGGWLARFRARNAGRWQTKNWDGWLGRLTIRLAKIGLKDTGIQTADHHPTEIALARATDTLFEALSSVQRKHLKALPLTVRQLETDATRLRADLQKLDDSIASFRGPASASLLRAEARDHDPSLVERENRIQSEVRATRDQLSDKLASTVSALENIRLDLLRLQIGTGRIESVTASLEAAREASADIAAVVEANADVERLLGPRATAKT